ncbi:outer membrane beta-barrel protein [Chitinophaga sp. Cy-1792]|uniref:outer membrane beta-barrel protein n=1 Tax=Chitinophaga sp. Cy-1792 TaxID=2608339 RepID=UPI0014233A81|nr:outer membrane beta-barrel protein [Chitinophaga sp. Cy-1792]NIG56471.1 PorT family protein [Chitinophaga sp. Cy-1792]
MKKILLVYLLFCSCFAARAQFRLGIKAGSGAAYHSKYTPPSDNTTMAHRNYCQGAVYSFYAGITGDWQISEHFSVQPSLLYSTKGGKNGETIYSTGGSYYYSRNYSGEDRLNYLELPVTLLFKQKLGRGKVFAGAGIYDAMYLNGQKEGDFLIRESPVVKNPEQVAADWPPVFGGRQGPIYPGKQADARLGDTGANFTAGYELPFGVQLALNYSLGFSETYYGKNRVYSLSVSYLLHK